MNGEVENVTSTASQEFDFCQSSANVSDTMSVSSIFLFSFNIGGVLVNSALILHLLLHQVTAPRAQKVFLIQSVLDSLVCAGSACGTIQTQLNFYPITNVLKPFDLLLCNFWHSGNAVYLFFHWSVNNMILQAADRAVCILSPIKYRLLSVGWYFFGYAINFALAVGTIIPYLTMEMIRDNQCQLCLFNEYFATHEVLAEALGHVVTVNLFVIPLISVTGIYGIILWKLRGGRWRSRLVSRATVKFTKLTFYTAVVFVVTQTYPTIAVYLHSDEYYDYESSVAILGATLTAANSAANPFIFFGDSFIRSLRRGGQKSDRSEGGTAAVSMSAMEDRRQE